MFGIGMVIFANGEDARITEQAILRVRKRLRHKPEFRFSKSSDALREAFFSALANCPFVVRALIVRKDVLYSQHLRANVDSFYNYFVKMLMAHDGGLLEAASVRIDGSGSQEFQRTLGAYLRRELGQRIKGVKMSDSARDPLMQLADMCIGAITRAERERSDGTRWRDMLRSRIGNIWRFR